MSTAKKSTKSVNANGAAKKNEVVEAFIPLYTKNVERLAELQKQSLDTAAEQNAELIDACKKAFPFIPETPGLFLFDLVGQSFNRFVETQKGAIDLAVQQSHVVAGIAINPTSCRENINQPNLAIRFIHHGMRDRANDGDRPALLFFYGDGNFGMRDQAVGFQHFLDFAFGLNFRKPGHMQAHGNQGKANGAGLADAQFAGNFGNVEDLDGNEIAGTNNIVARRWCCL